MANFKLWKSEELQRLRSESDRMFDRLCSELGLPSVCQPLMEPALRMIDTPEAVVVEAQLPGVTPEDLDIVITGTVLIVRCAQNETCGIGESASRYESRFMLPCKVRTEDVEAELDEGVLRITMPKCRRPEARRVPVRTGRAG